MARFKTFANGGTLAPGDVNSLRSASLESLAIWRPIWRGATATHSIISPYTPLLTPGNYRVLNDWVTDQLVFTLSGGYIKPDDPTTDPRHVIFLRPEAVPTGLAEKLRWKIVVATNAVAQPDSLSFTVGLFQSKMTLVGSVSSFQMASSSVPGSGFTFPVARNIASTTKFLSQEMPVPAAGLYGALMATNLALPATGRVLVLAELQRRVVVA